MTVVNMDNVFGLKMTVDFTTPRSRLVFEGDGVIESEDGEIIKSGDFTITVALDERKLDELKKMV